MGSSQSVPTLYVELCPRDDAAVRYCNHGQFHPGDSGLDLFVVDDFIVEENKTKLVNLHVRCQAYTLKGDLWSRLVRVFKKQVPESHKLYTGYWLCPRSSLSKMPLMMANSIGVIDKEYTGELQVPLRNVSNLNWCVNAGERLVQIVGPQHNPIELSLVPKLRVTKRGDGGFGSTNEPRDPQPQQPGIPRSMTDPNLFRVMKPMAGWKL